MVKKGRKNKAAKKSTEGKANAPRDPEAPPTSQSSQDAVVAVLDPATSTDLVVDGELYGDLGVQTVRFVKAERAAFAWEDGCQE